MVSSNYMINGKVGEFYIEVYVLRSPMHQPKRGTAFLISRLNTLVSI